MKNEYTFDGDASPAELHEYSADRNQHFDSVDIIDSDGNRSDLLSEDHTENTTGSQNNHSPSLE